MDNVDFIDNISVSNKIENELESITLYYNGIAIVSITTPIDSNLKSSLSFRPVIINNERLVEVCTSYYDTNVSFLDSLPNRRYMYIDKNGKRRLKC